MNVSDIMTRAPWTVGVADKVLQAVTLMRERQIRHLPVMDGERLVGIITDRDLRWLLGQSIHGGGGPQAEALGDQVGEVMTSNPVTVSEHAPVLTAVDLLVEKRIGGLPVTNALGALVGIITYVDVLRACRELLRGA